MKQLAFIVFQDNDNARYLVDAITQDNPHAEVQYQPAMIRIQAEKRLEIRRETVEEMIRGRRQLRPRVEELGGRP
jgi:phenol/toluene 2-monooxygenase (NADH) P2/A2